MSVGRFKDAQGRTRFEFEFSRYIAGKRIRVRKSLPLGWDQARADKYDREESARLYAAASGIEKEDRSIEDAVACYFRERIPELKHGQAQMKEMTTMRPWFLGNPLSKLREVCAKYLDANRGELAAATIKNRMRYLVSACRWAWKRKRWCDQDPGAGIEFPSVRNERHVYITRAEMLRLAKCCKSWEVRALIRIAFYSGMRMGEITAAAVGNDHFVLPDSKNGDPVRIMIHPKVRALVHYAWPTRYIIGYHFRAARAAAGLEHVRFHDIRHSTASDLVSSGHSLFVVGKVLRHKSQASTGRYAHLRDEVLNDAINSIGRKRA